jgi:hypothetical protein
MNRQAAEDAQEDELGRIVIPTTEGRRNLPEDEGCARLRVDPSALRFSG